MIRLLRIELRRNAALAMVPVYAALWLASPIARHLAPIALWPDRSTDIQSTVFALCPVTAGVAAWTADREHRRRATDLLATTSRSAVGRCLAALGATACWAALGYLIGAVVMVAITAHQATWGHVVVLPLLDGLMAVLAAAALGFALGRVLPGRFTAPLAAMGLLGLLVLGVETTTHATATFFGALSPAFPSINLNLSVFFPIRSGLVILQLATAVGVLCAAIGVIVAHAGGRRAGLAVATAGVLLLAVPVGLAGASHRDAQGAIVVPGLDSVAAQQPLPFTPVCSGGAIPVCVHPAYAAKLSVLDTAINRLASPLLGTPGLPVRVEEGPVSLIQDVTVHGTPPVLEIPPVFIQHDTLDEETTVVNDIVALALVGTPGRPPAQASPAQRAVALALVRLAGAEADPRLLPTDAAIRAAADRLGVLTPDALHDWLVAHMASVRAGTINLEEMP